MAKARARRIECSDGSSDDILRTDALRWISGETTLTDSPGLNLEYLEEPPSERPYEPPPWTLPPTGRETEREL